MVTIQQAAANAFAAWLASQLPGVEVEPRWPAPNKKKPPKSITVTMAGRRRDTPLDPHLIKMTNQGSTQVRAVWQIAACTQPFQLDVWAQSEPARDDLLARLDELLHAGESSLASAFAPTGVGTGNLIAVADGWEDCGTTADFIFDEPFLDISSDTQGRSIYRATFHGECHVILALTKVHARQLLINFKLRLGGTDEVEANVSSDNYTLTEGSELLQTENGEALING